MVSSEEKSQHKKIISWIVPCFNEEEVIDETFERISRVCDSIERYKWEIIFIDDGSKDFTFKKIQSLLQKRDGLTYIGLSRNYGHQIAVQAGLNNAIGDSAIIIDADLQDPPELANELLEKWENGFDVVYGKRIDRESESFFKKSTAKLFYRLINILSDTNIPLDVGDFRLIDRKVITAIHEMPEKERFLRGMISWVGFNQTYIKYIRQKRYAGKSKYPLKKMITFAINGITSFSRKPLKISIYLGLISSLISILGILYVLYIRFMTSNWVTGWAGLALAILFSSGIQLLSIGILGEYIGKIYIESKNRPLYFIKQSLKS